MLTVACVRNGTGYGEEYVRKLSAMVARYLSLPYRFRVVRDPPQLSGAHPCWSKLWMFEPGFADDAVLYFDLDTIICGPIDGLVTDGPFRAIKEFAGRPTIGSGVMSWIPGAQSAAIAQRHHREKPTGKPGGTYRGDQDFITSVIGDHWEPFREQDVVSFKRDCQHGIPITAKVVAFHGHPKPHEVLDVPYVAAHWR